MKDKLSRYESEDIGRRIYTMRGQRVIIDIDLAEIYGVSTKRLNEQVKRNIKRFPDDFMYQLTKEEAQNWQRLRSQIATLKRGQHLKYQPYVFTEHGAIMAANVLNSPKAIEMSVFVVRAFIKMRGTFVNNKALAQKLAELEKKLTERLDVHEVAIVGILQRIMNLIDPPLLPAPPRKSIGFKVKEKAARYQVTRKRTVN